MTKGSIAVIVPVYNSADFLEGCVRSIEGQIAPGDSIWLVDDCSTDGSALLAREIAGLNAQVSTVILAENMGVSVARNVGICESASDYLMFVDPDDQLPEGAVNSLRAALDSGFDAVQGSMEVLTVGTGSSKIRRANSDLSCTTVSGEDAFIALCRGELPSSVCSFGFRRLALSAEFRPDWRFEDFTFLVDNLPGLATVGFIDDLVYQYRRREGSETGELRESVRHVSWGAEVAVERLGGIGNLSEEAKLFLAARLRVWSTLVIVHQVAAFGDLSEHGAVDILSSSLYRMKWDDCWRVAWSSDRFLGFAGLLALATPRGYVRAFRLRLVVVRLLRRRSVRSLT